MTKRITRECKTCGNEVFLISSDKLVMWAHSNDEDNVTHDGR